MAHLVERSLPTPEMLSSKPVVGKICTLDSIEMTKIKKKRPGMAHVKQHKVRKIKSKKIVTKIHPC